MQTVKGAPGRGDAPGDVAVYGRLLSYVVPYWAAFLLSMAGFMIYSLSNVGFVQLVGYIVDSLGGMSPLDNPLVAPVFENWFGDDQAANRIFIPSMIVAIVVARGIGTFVGNYYISFIGTNLVHALRCELFDRLLSLPSKFFDRNAMGHLVAKVTYHVTQVTGAATDAVRVLIREGLTVIGYLAFLFYLNWKLTLIFLAVAPLIALLVNYAGKRFRRISERIQDSMGDVTHVASEAVQGYRVVRTFGGTQYEREKFDRVSDNNRRQTMKMVVTSSVATPVIQIVVAIALALLVWLVLDPVLMADMSPGDVVAFISTGGLLAKPIRQLSEIQSTVQKGLAAASDIFDLFDEETEIDEGTRQVERAAGKVEFRDVSFQYDEDPVLHSVSFVASPGETIALVGRSGSGKSTLVSLIPRFYLPTSGEILLDDVPIDQVSLASLRAQISIVSQDVTLFNATVAENIAYGTLHDTPSAEIEAAARKAYAWDFICELGEGLDTIVGDDGVLLSGGQRQRIAIARAFLKDAPILILDEATSALDSESEAYIQRALAAVVKGRTTFVIAHRLSTIEKADRILVVDQGRIVEEGNHADLLKQQGFYTNLHNRQRPGYISAVRPAHENWSADFKPVPTSPEETMEWLSDDFNPLVSAWYNDASWPRLLTPLALLYQVLARMRRRRYETRPGLRFKAPVPVIIAGNINVGGTGKSPLVIWLAKQLREQGRRPGIVSRGYGGKPGRVPIEVTALTDPVVCGDEAVMISRRTQCPVVVHPDRVLATRQLLAEYECDVVISDDGLQHYALDRNVEIVVIDGSRGLGNGRCLPAGPLREPPSRLAEVDFVVVNGDSRFSWPVPVLAMKLVPACLVNLGSQFRGEIRQVDLGKTIHAVAGIGNPDRFFATLRSLGWQLIEHRFDDHHKFRMSDLMFGDTVPVVMTEKDAVKVRLLNPTLVHDNFWYLEVDVEMPETFLPALLDRLNGEKK